jgi:hypothetical protein
MIWVLLGLLVYIQIGALLVAWVFADMTIEAGRMDMLSLVLLWPFAIHYFKFALHARRLMRALQEWDQNSK